MTNARTILEFLDVPTSGSFNMTPAEALAFLQKKGLKLGFNWQDVLAEEHAKSFTIAKMMDTDMLAKVKGSLEDALAAGTSFKEWSDTITPTLQAAGWWGRKAVLGPDGSTVVAQLGSPARLQTIYRTNMASAYSTGQWASIVEQSDLAPFLLYDAVNDARTRPEHHAWDGTTLPITDPWWNTHYPPNGWNCRCTVIQLSEDDAQAMGLATHQAPPKQGTYNWTNPATGKVLKIPVGVDPSFATNLGEAAAKALQKAVTDKLASYEASVKAAAEAGLLEAAAAAKATVDAEIAAAQAVAAEAIKADKLAATAMATEEHAAAMAVNTHLLQNTPYMANAIKTVQKTKGAAGMSQADVLDAAKSIAAKSKANADLAHYKQAILKGKTPPAAAQAAFDALPAEASQAVTAQLDAKLGAKAIQKQAQAEMDAFTPASPQGKALANALKDTTTEAMTPTELLAKVIQDAAQAEAAKVQANLLKQAEKLLVKGEMVTPGPMADAVGKLYGADMDAFLAKVDKAKAKALAKATKDADAIGPQITMKAGESIPAVPPLPVKAGADWLASAMKAVANNKTLSPSQAKAVGALNPKELIDFYLQAGKMGQSVADKAKLTVAKAAPKVEAVTADGTLNVDKLVQIGPQKGSNRGGLYQDQSTGTKWYVKIPDGGADQARNEVLSGKIYALAGVDVPELRLIVFNGEPAVASRFAEGLEKTTTAKLAKTAGATDNFAVDAWLANWDVVGADVDNLLVKGGHAFRVDAGGGLRYRAMGGTKGAAWSDDVTELDSMRNAGTNRQSAAVFGNMTKSQIDESARRLLAIDRDEVAALVQKYGPADMGEREALKRTLLARLDDIEAKLKLKVVVKEPKAPPIVKGGTHISADQMKRVTQARANGYTIPTDGGMIEDHQVLLQHFTNAAGKPSTRLVVKLRADAAAEATKVLQARTGASEMISLEDLRTKTLSLAKSINSRAEKGKLFDETVTRRLAEFRTAYTSAIRAMSAIPIGAKEAVATRAAIAKIGARITQWEAEQGGAGVLKTIGNLPTGLMKDVLPKAVKAAGADKDGLTWVSSKVFSYGKGTVSKGALKETSTTLELSDTPRVLVGKADGTTVQFAVESPNNSVSTRGLVHIEVDGQDMAAVDRAMKTLSDMGVTTTVTTEGEQLGLYLDKIANIRFLRDKAKASEYTKASAIKDEAERNAAKLKMVNDDVGYDMTKSAGWNPEGEHQAFGHGRNVLTRPDLDGPAWEEFERTTQVYHNVTGLQVGASDEQWSILKRIIDGGGMLSSQVERARRGLEMTGQTSDFSTGGANYIFTRLVGKDINRAGVYFKPRVVKRIDAFVYDGDKFGNVSRSTQLESRQNTVQGFREAMDNRSNETNFRDGLSLFDDLDRIVFRTEAERKTAIADMRAMGYITWPDGRELTKVLLGPGKQK